MTQALLSRTGPRAQALIADQVIVVAPVDGGWSVDSPSGEPLMFLSSRSAEAHARRLADGLARAGVDTRIDVHDRTNALVGSLRCFGETPNASLKLALGRTPARLTQ